MPKTLTGRILTLGSAFVALGVPIVRAQDWPQWRGPDRDGVAHSSSLPKAWPEKLKLKWKVSVGEGHSSPVVAGGRVFVLTRQGDREVASALNVENGNVLWRESYPAPYAMNPAATAHGKGPKSTPEVSNGKLYTLGISGILSCFDIATGRLRWRKDFSGQFKETSPLYGTAMSPLVVEGLLIVHVGGHDQGALTAFDAETGQPKWSWKGDGPGYASPIEVELEGTRQAVTQTQQNIVGVSLSDGKLLWRVPFTTDYIQNIVTPVAFHQTLIFSGLDKGTMALKVIRRGSGWSTERVWHNPDVSMYMNSPVVHGNLLFGLSHRRKGQYFCLDARTGATLWTSDGRQGDNAAIERLGGILLLLSSDAEMIVARAGDKAFEPVRRYTVADSPTWAHPVLVAQGVLVKDNASLTLWGLD